MPGHREKNMKKAREELAKTPRAPRCPAGYMSRTYRTDPKLHAAILKQAAAEALPGGAGQLLTQIAIDYITKKTGKRFKNEFVPFYKNNPKNKGKK